jgi:hypothetical protein
MSSRNQRRKRRWASHRETEWRKVCPCCGQTHDEDSWHALPHHGYTEISQVEALEYRTCRCGSTLCRKRGRYDGRGLTVSVLAGKRKFCDHDFNMKNAWCTAIEWLRYGASEAVIARREWI